MCVGTAMAVAAVASSAVSASGSIMAGNSAKKAGDYNAQVMARRAQSELDAAQAEAMQIQQDAQRKMGDATAAFGASGVVTSSGTPLEVMADMAAQGELSKQLRLYQGKLAARADVEQGQLDIMQGKAAQSASQIQAAGSLLGGISKAVDYWPSTSTAPKVA